MRKDPLSAIFKLTSIAREKELPQGFEEDFKELKEMQRSIKPDEMEKWKELYEKASMLSVRLHAASLDSMRDVGKKSGDREVVEDKSEYVQEVKLTIPQLERALRNAQNYVKTSRLDRQKTEMLKNLKNAVSNKHIEIEQSEGKIDASFNLQWQKQMKTFATQSIDAWNQGLFGGLSSRVKKEWNIYQPTFNNALEILNLDALPRSDVYSTQIVEHLKFPGEKEEKLLTFWPAVLKVMRSTLGLIMMVVMMASSFATMIGSSKGEMRSYIFMIFIPIALVVAFIMGRKESAKSVVVARAKIKSLLRKEMLKNIDDLIAEVVKKMKGNLDRYTASYERKWNGWTHATNKKLELLQRKSRSFKGGASQKSAPSRLKYVVEDLENKIIPQIEQRLGEFDD